MSLDSKIAELGIEIPPAPPKGTSYSSVVIDGSTAYTSGCVAVFGPPWSLGFGGSVGDEVSQEDAAKSAERSMLCTLANLKDALDGSLDRVDRFLKLTGYVRCKPDFNGPPAVMDGASALLTTIFGEDLLPARTAIGVASLPGGASVELDTIVRLRP